MICSKIFTGDLPELTYNILKYLQDDFSTLYSCVLVNRLWCRLAIPLLWENPFSISTGNRNFIEIYLDNLDGDLKTRLDNYKVNDNSLSSHTLFNYPEFLKYLNIFNIIDTVKKWFYDTVNKSKCRNRYDIIRDNYSVINFIRLIHTSLFKIFNENEVNLHTLEIEISCTDFDRYDTYYDNIFESIIQNTNFIHNIRYLNLYTDDTSEKLLYDDASKALFKNRMLQLINLHQNLKEILLDHNNLPLYQSLLLSKDSNCSNTLNTIIFYGVNFKGMVNLTKTFEQLNVLESVHIFFCTLNDDFIQQIINLTKPFKLKSLYISEIPRIESLQLLLQNSGDYIENFKIDFEDYSHPSLLLKQQFVELIIKYCKNIKLLELSIFENQIIYPIFKLIENIKQSLKYLTIYLQNRNVEMESSSIVLQNLGQILPPKLEYLNLNLYIIKANDFEIFLKNSQDIFIKKLLIKNINGQNILPFIKEYSMKKKMIKYLALSNIIYERFSGGSSYGQSEQLSSLNDEVNEFTLYNIKVQSYSSLMILMYDLIRGVK
ncbi:hypothetical protein GLOIN_2v1881853 [Rhizophagus clarus]|nr:hypothetical protein GLOIN_2v1881853 [Rhizophagus clarus]